MKTCIPPIVPRIIAILCLSASPSAARAGADETIETAGDIIQILNPLTALGISYFKSDWEGLAQISKTIGVNFVATHVLKRGLNNVKLGDYQLGERPNGGDFNFPSGHTSAAFSGAWYLHKRYGIRYSAAPLAGAVFVGYSRIHSDHHDLAGVLAGAAVGILSAEIFTRAITDETVTMGVGYEGGSTVQFYFTKKF